MIVKFLKNKGNGSARATMNYLLGKDRDREQAKVLQGDPDLTERLADNLHQFKNRYTVGVLSFEEKDLDDKTKKNIMADFEKSLLAGLEADQYNMTWIEHRDKGRLELNFVIVNQELHTGKRLQPYYDKIDRPLVENWKQVTNHKYGLSDPNDPQKAQAIKIDRHNLPKDVQGIKQRIGEAIAHQIEQGNITDRKGVIEALEGAGIEITRQTDKSISIKNPEGKRNIRLEGFIYENREFSQELGTEHREAKQDYERANAERYATAFEKLQRAIGQKQATNRENFKRPPSANREPPQRLEQDLKLQNGDRGHNGLATGDHARARDIQSMVSEEYSHPTGTTSRNTAEHRPVAPTGEGFSQSGLGRRKGRDLHSEQERDKSRNLPQQGQTNNSKNQIGLLDHAKRFYERLQQFGDRLRATVKRVTGNHHQAERTNRAIDCGQSQFDRTEREIKQREQATGEHQRTAERFTHQVIREIQNEINPQQSKGMKR